MPISQINSNSMGTASVLQPAVGANVAGTGPAFSAFPVSNVTISSSVETVVVNNGEVFDTNGCYNNTGSTVTLNGISVPAYSFAPNVAGYYLITVTLNTESSVALSRFILLIGTPGGSYRVSDTFVNAGPSLTTGSILLYFNGTSDFASARAYITATTPTYSGSFPVSRFSGHLVRAA
jgi:hypothetical protein